MRRREFVTLLGGAAVAWALTARAQQAMKMPRIGILSPGRSELSDPNFNVINAFLQGLHDLGYTEGQSLAVERRYADGKSDRLTELADELVSRKPDVIVAFSTTAARPAKQATGIIPIVAIAMANPVGDELVASLARPGGNVTGTTFLGPELAAKRLQLLREVVPALYRVAALWHPNAYSKRTMAGLSNEIEVAARTLKLQLQLVPAFGPDDLVGAFAAITRERADALIVMPSPMLFGEYKRIASLAATGRLPAMGAAREFVDVGGLMSYGANLAATKGGRPGRHPCRGQGRRVKPEAYPCGPARHQKRRREKFAEQVHCLARYNARTARAQAWPARWPPRCRSGSGAAIRFHGYRGTPAQRPLRAIALLGFARETCAAVSAFNGSSARLRQAAPTGSARSYYDRFGWLPVLDRRSDADRRSTPDRRSPMRLFSSPLRVSTPLRRSFPERRSDPLRLSSTVMGLLLCDLH